MRTPLDIPTHLVKDATLYAPSRDPLDAVCHVLQDYPRLVSEVRELRRRVTDLDGEGTELDDLLARLQNVARQILDL
ncbi:hypothetical protein BVH03_09430 [Pseudomonas sp. PA15(2017)]|uniref:hypothetical protein n=1 Tax=Pseudomonas sp. PA15(2017) TaxID=1932111 RepID=UPI00095B4CB8|nr:hypothetical protein [Pseudomonas sp. PA15(2017)]OLU30702.1 hypothetical protein BVH03_09430 [Pseudomonas sp. PA15(2017)]